MSKKEKAEEKTVSLMRNYAVTLEGVTPFLMHAIDTDWNDEISDYRKKNKKKGKAGDDRSPAWSWLGYVYHDGDKIGIPSDNLMTMMRDGASLIVVSGNKTFKAQSQSGLLVNEILWPITVGGKEVSWEPISELMNNPDFSLHQQTAKDNNFKLFVKSATIGKSKHTRVRPRFDRWMASGTIAVFDEMITTEILEEILNKAGQYCGIGDWRPKSPKAPGQFGKFVAHVKQID